MSNDVLQEAYKEDFMYDYFLKGAPVMLTWNINSPQGLSNGTLAILKNILWDPFSQYYLNGYPRGAPGSIVTLDEVPKAVVVQIQNPVANLAWMEKHSLDPRELIVPLPQEYTEQSYDIFVKGKKKKISAKGSSYDLAYAITYHKVQGKTLGRVLLHIEKGINLRLQSLFVGLSRVRKGDDFRIIPPRLPLDYNFQFLNNLKLGDKAQALFKKGFDQNGKWLIEKYK